jgi:hypothetical protein
LAREGVIYQTRVLLFFVQKKLAIFIISGIITTNLGKTATHTKNRRARKDGYTTPKIALLLKQRGAFFLPDTFALNVYIIIYYNKI